MKITPHDYDITTSAKPNEVKEEMVNISMIPLLNTLAQVKFANTNAARYFLEIYALINDLDKKLLDLYPETKLFVKCQQIKFFISAKRC